MIACGEGDSSVGIPSFCDDFDVELYPNKVKVIPVKTFEKIQPLEMSLDLMKASEHEIERKLYPIFKNDIYEGELDTLMTQNSWSKYREAENQRGKEAYFEDIMQKPYKEQEYHFKKHHKGDEAFWNEFRGYKQKQKQKRGL